MMRVDAAASVTRAARAGLDNEDAVLALDDVPLYAVVDGTGDPRAAPIALDVLERHAPALQALRRKVLEQPSAAHRLAIARFFEAAFAEASAAVRGAWEDGETRRMTASMVAMTVADRFAWIAHVGNARAYLIRVGRPSPLTVDHTLAMYQVRRGELSAAEYATSPFRKTLTQALGASGFVNPDIAEVQVAAGDRILLASDGVYRAVPASRLRDLLATERPPRSLAAALVEAAFEAGSRDDATATVIAIAADARAPAPETLDVAAALGEIFLFRALDDAERLLLAPYFEHQRFERGHALCREGELGDTFFVVVRGRARVTHGDAALVELGPGDHAGEIALACGGERTATITALEPTETLTLSRDRFVEIVRRRPELCQRVLMPLLRSVGDRVVDLRARLEGIGRVLGQ